MKKNKSKIPLIIIPVRMGSKRLKNKNILPIKGLPMFVFVAKEVQKSKFSPLIYVSSESVKIQNICKKFSINFIKRPKKLSLSYVEKQLAIVHAVRNITKKNKFKSKIIISLQANSPEIKFKDLDKAIIFFKNSFQNKKNKELISVGKNNLQNAAFRIMTYSAVFQRSLSTNICIYKKNYTDIHSMNDYKKVLKKI
tara:strand:+ start:1330 stop:1917 length:588 start_codon:yes stop_codon:yes gene_type:complete